jgi:WD40 repeat protein
MNALDASGPGEAGRFYVTGGTLPIDAGSYVPRRADEELYDTLLARQFCYILTSRQVGKSSLMVRTAVRLREAGVGVAVTDLTAFGQNLDPEQWYEGLLSRIGQQLDLEDELEDFWDDHESMGPLLRWVEAIRTVVLAQRDTPIVIFVDEIDVVRSLGFSTDEFFAAIRECHNRRASEPEMQRLTFCLIGVATPTDLIEDTRLTPFNIGARIELADLTEEDAAPLAGGMGGGGEAGRRLLRRVFHWTNGHPYLTQKLCAAVAAADSVASNADVDRVCEDRFLSDRARDMDDNLVYVRERMLRSEVDRAALLDTYAKLYAGKHVRFDDGDRVITVLFLSGITSGRNGQLHMRNRIYERVFDRAWIRENMPDAEVRRQRSAYRRGVLRTGVAALAVVAVVATLASVALKQAQQARAATGAALDLAARSQIARGVQLLDSGDGLGLLHLLAARNTAPESSDMAQAAERLWSGWYPLYQDRLRNMIQHAGSKSMVVSPDGRTMAIGTATGDIHLWNVATGRALSPVIQHVGPPGLWAIAFSPDGTRLAMGSQGGIAQVWDAQTGEPVGKVMRQDGSMQVVVFSPDGQSVAIASQGLGTSLGVTRIWDYASGQVVGPTFRHPNGNAWTVAFSPSGSILATGSDDGTARLWDIATGTLVAPPMRHDGFVFQIQFSPDGRLLATASQDGTVGLWSAVTGEPVLQPLPHSGGVSHVAFSTDSRLLAAGEDNGTVSIWDMGTITRLAAPLPHQGAVHGLDFGPGGDLLISSAEDGMARFWAIPDRMEPAKTYPEAGWAFAFDSSGARLAVAYADETIRIHHPHSQQSVGPALTSDGVVSEMAFSPDGRLLAAGSLNGSVQMWRADTGVPYGDPLVHGEPMPGISFGVAFSPDGSRLASVAADGTLKLWDVHTHTLAVPTMQQPGRVDALAFNPDGETIATGASGGVTFWNVSDGTRLTSPFSYHGWVFNLAFSPDGTLLATASSDSHVRLWDMESGQQTVPPMQHGGTVSGVAFSPDGALLVTGAADHTARLWDVATGKPLGPPLVLDSWVWRVAFHPTAAQFVTAEYLPAPVRIWDLPPWFSGSSAIETRSWAALGVRMTADEQVENVPEEQWRAYRARVHSFDKRLQVPRIQP